MDNTEKVRCIKCAYLCLNENEEITEQQRREVYNYHYKKHNQQELPLAPNQIRCYRNILEPYSEVPIENILRIVVGNEWTCYEWQRHHNGVSPKTVLDIQREYDFKIKPAFWTKWEFWVAIAVPISMYILGRIWDII